MHQLAWICASRGVIYSIYLLGQSIVHSVPHIIIGKQSMSEMGPHIQYTIKIHSQNRKMRRQMEKRNNKMSKLNNMNKAQLEQHFISMIIIIIIALFRLLTRDFSL